MHEELCAILGSRYVYFQPPASIKLTYPCIVYTLSSVDKINANNRMYKSNNRYEVTIITEDPDNTLYIDALNHFEMCRFDRSFVSDNLYHYNLALYY